MRINDHFKPCTNFDERMYTLFNETSPDLQKFWFVRNFNDLFRYGNGADKNEFLSNLLSIFDNDEDIRRLCLAMAETLAIRDKESFKRR